MVHCCDSLTNTLYDFNGCVFHGCPRCFPERSRLTKFHPDRTLQEVYEATRRKQDLLAAEGYNVHVKWECEWDHEVKEDADLATFLETLEIVDPSNPREAFFGGRTNDTALYCKADESGGEQIKYADVTTLYLWVKKNATYSVGHPVIIRHLEDQDITHYFSMGKVSIVPPYGLYHLVLLSRCGGKLVMTLCRKCAEEQLRLPVTERTHYCIQHLDAGHTPLGTWCTPELVKAV